MSCRERAKKPQAFPFSTMLWAIPQAPIFLLRKPLRLDPPNLLGLATLTSKRQWGWTQFWGECITQMSHPGKGGCFLPGKAWLPSMHPYLPLQIIALKVATSSILVSPSPTKGNQSMGCPGAESSTFSPGRGERLRHSLELSLPGEGADIPGRSQECQTASHLAKSRTWSIDLD